MGEGRGQGAIRVLQIPVYKWLLLGLTDWIPLNGADKLLEAVIKAEPSAGPLPAINITPGTS